LQQQGGTVAAPAAGGYDAYGYDQQGQGYDQAYNNNQNYGKK